MYNSGTHYTFRWSAERLESAWPRQCFSRGRGLAKPLQKKWIPGHSTIEADNKHHPQSVRPDLKEALPDPQAMPPPASPPVCGP